MGKSRRDREKAKARNGTTGGSIVTGDSDNESVASEATHFTLADELESVAGEAPQLGVEENEGSSHSIEAHLIEYLDNATTKNKFTKSAALKQLAALLCRYVMPEPLLNNRISVLDVVEKILRKGTPEDSILALRIYAIHTIQIGNDISDDVTKLLAQMRPLCADESLAKAFRVELATVIGLCCYVAVDEVETMTQCISTLRSVWLAVKSGNVDVEHGPLFAAAVSAYTLILCHMPNRAKEEAFNNDVPKLANYLESNQMEIRIAAGEALALLYELARKLYQDERWRPPTHQKIVERLGVLANDAMKFRAKKDRRVQRNSFRHIEQAIKDGEFSDVKIKFGQNEELILTDWASLLSYNTICAVLRSAMPTHLQKNQLLRAMFDLGGIRTARSYSELNDIKQQKQAQWAAAEKSRQISRGKQRGKRLDSLSGA